MTRSVIVAGGLLAAILPASNTIASQITSSDFSIGYGYSSPGSWNTSETTGANIDISGPFSLDIVPHAYNYVGSGITFPGRVPTNGGAGMLSGAANNGNVGGVFNVPISASYTGPAPVDAAPVPNYRLVIEITSISVYAGANESSLSLAFNETTPGHAQVQGAGISLIDSGNDFSTAQGTVASYTKLSWDPADYENSIVGVNDPSQRVFSTDAPSSHVVFLDGLEITGRVHLYYDAVPEPGAMAMLGTLAIGLLARRQRR